jgi:serine acetyltransferase
MRIMYVMEQDVWIGEAVCEVFEYKVLSALKSQRHCRTLKTRRMQIAAFTLHQIARVACQARRGVPHVD